MADEVQKKGVLVEIVRMVLGKRGEVKQGGETQLKQRKGLLVDTAGMVVDKSGGEDWVVVA